MGQSSSAGTELTNEALADRVVNYADALAAFSLVNALAFVITLGEPDIRCSIAGIAGPLIAVNVALMAIVTAGLVFLRRFERSLRADEDEDPRVERFWRIVQGVRFALVWSVVTLIALGLWGSRQDPLCQAALG